eukprot:scaffold195820_cov30-Tisochrysis_lutea.AAC.5
MPHINTEACAPGRLMRLSSIMRPISVAGIKDVSQCMLHYGMGDGSTSDLWARAIKNIIWP